MESDQATARARGSRNSLQPLLLDAPLPNPFLMQRDDAPTMTPGGVRVADMPGEWWAIRCRGGVEKAFARGLDKRGIGYFLPLWEDRDKKPIVYRAALSGYIFINGSEVEISHASEQRDFQGFVRECLQYETRRRLREDLINLQEFLDDKPAMASTLGIGKLVEVKRNHRLCGKRGKVLYYEQGVRFVVEIELLGRGVETEIDPGDVELLD